VDTEVTHLNVEWCQAAQNAKIVTAHADFLACLPERRLNGGGILGFDTASGQTDLALVFSYAIGAPCQHKTEFSLIVGWIEEKKYPALSRSVIRSRRRKRDRMGGHAHLCLKAR
jgi:hypothetical protein